MKAFRKNLSDFVHKGLRTTPELGRRKGDLALCYNFIVDAGGLTPYEAINNKFSARLLSVWPFPQVYYGIQNSFIFDEDAIYDIDGETELASVPNGGSRWDIVDYFGYVILCNSNYCLYRDAVSGDIASITASDSIPTFKTACDFRGQLFIGNITSEWNDCGESHVAWSQIGNADFSLTKRNEANFTRLPFDG